MELHSYAKRRAVKKWSVEQKRRLVEARITCDEIFRMKSKTSLLPWKKVIFQGKLDDFNAVFVRKQWANMVTKYMQYKQDRLGNKPTHDIDAETINKITQEWEFFQPIHRYMTRKTTNLHSYALSSQKQQEGKVGEFCEEDSLEHEDPKQQNELNGGDAERNKQQPASTSSNERLNICSSDTNEDATMLMLPLIPRPNTDHDFYSKKIEQQQCYFADVEEDTLESTTMDVSTATTIVNGSDIVHTEEYVVHDSQVIEEKPEVESVGIENQDVADQVDIKQEQHEVTNSDNTNSQNLGNNTISERDKYYQHKRRFNHRMERRVDAVLNVIGQIAKMEYPNINIKPLIEVTNGLMQKVLDSSDEGSGDENGNARN